VTPLVICFCLYSTIDNASTTTTTMSQRNARTQAPAPIPRRPTRSATTSATRDGGDVPTAINAVDVTGAINAVNVAGAINTNDTDAANDGSAPRSRRSARQGAATATATAPSDTRAPEITAGTKRARATGSVTIVMRAKAAPQGGNKYVHPPSHLAYLLIFFTGNRPCSGSRRIPPLEPIHLALEHGEPSSVDQMAS
jgi:hypothetical protein